MEHVARRIMPECSCAGLQVNILSKTQVKDVLLGYILEFFLPGTLKTKSCMENLTQRWTQSGSFFLEFIYLFILYFMFTFTIKSIKHSDLYNSLFTNSNTNGIQ